MKLLQHLATDLAVIWVSILVYDVVIFGLTIYRVARVGPIWRGGLFGLLLRDGKWTIPGSHLKQIALTCRSLGCFYFGYVDKQISSVSVIHGRCGRVLFMCHLLNILTCMVCRSGSSKYHKLIDLHELQFAEVGIFLMVITPRAQMTPR